MMFAFLMLGAIVVLKFFPETAAAPWLQRMMIDLPFDAAKRLERRHLIFFVLMTLIVVFGAELLAMGGPLDMGLVIMWDVSTYIDVIVAAGTLAAVARSRAAWQTLADRIRAITAPRRTGRARRPQIVRRRETPPANDDDRPRFAIAC